MTVEMFADGAQRRPRGGAQLRIECPHCRHTVRVRSSERLTATAKEVRLQCSNMDCDATYVGTVTIDRMVRDSATPNPAIRLPKGSPRPRHAGNDNYPSPALAAL